MKYSELQELEDLLTERLCVLRAQGASPEARLTVARWLANIVIQKAATHRRGLGNTSLYLPQSSEAARVASGSAEECKMLPSREDPIEVRANDRNPTTHVSSVSRKRSRAAEVNGGHNA